MEVVKEIGQTTAVAVEQKSSRARDFWKKWRKQKTAFWAGFFNG